MASSYALDKALAALAVVGFIVVSLCAHFIFRTPNPSECVYQCAQVHSRRVLDCDVRRHYAVCGLRGTDIVLRQWDSH